MTFYSIHESLLPAWWRRSFITELEADDNVKVWISLVAYRTCSCPKACTPLRSYANSVLWVFSIWNLIEQTMKVSIHFYFFCLSLPFLGFCREFLLHCSKCPAGLPDFTDWLWPLLSLCNESLFGPLCFAGVYSMIDSFVLDQKQRNLRLVCLSRYLIAGRTEHFSWQENVLPKSKTISSPVRVRL